MIDWIYDHGVWRGRSFRGIHYRLEWKGGYWLGRINNPQGHPTFLGRFEHAHEGKAFCMERERNAAGTVDRERGMRLEVRG